MRASTGIRSLLICGLVASLLATVTPSVAPPPHATPAPDAAAPLDPGADGAVPGSLPLLFIPNAGQFDPAARFLAYGVGHQVWLADDGLWLTVSEASAASADTTAATPTQQRLTHVRVTFPDANPGATLEPLAALETRANYFLGNDPARWKSDLPTYTGVRYRDLYEEVDLVLGTHQGRLAWRWESQSAAALASTRLRLAGLTGLTLANDALSGDTAVGPLTVPLPATLVQGRPVAPTGPAMRIDGDTVAPSGAPGLPVLPVAPAVAAAPAPLTWSTFIGNDFFNRASAVRDIDGEALVAGSTVSALFPTVGGVNSTFNGFFDAFVAKFNGNASALRFATFLGGGGSDSATGLADGAATDPIVVAGTTFSLNFPFTANAHDGIGDALN